MKDTTPGPTPERTDEQALDFSDDEDSLGTGEPSLQQSARPSPSTEGEIGLTGAATLGESEHEDNVSLAQPGYADRWQRCTLAARTWRRRCQR